MSLYLNKKTQTSNTYDQKNILEYIYKPWKWIDGEWVKEPYLEPNLKSVLESRFESCPKSYIVEVSND